MTRFTRLRILTAAAALAVGGLVSAGHAQDTITAKPAFAPLPTPEAVLSRPSAERIVLRDGITLITTPPPLQFTADKAENALKLAGEDLTITVTKSLGFTVKCGPQTLTLERQDKAMSFRPVTLKLADGGSYALAFPYGYAYAGRSAAQQRAISGYLFCRSGGVQQFTLDGQTICLYDHNTDGVYKTGEDAVALGDPAACRVFAPLGTMLATKTGVYQVKKLSERGTEIELVKSTDKAGALAVSFDGKDLSASVSLVSVDGSMGIALTPGGGAQVAVPPGKYEVSGGLVFAGGKPVATLATGELAAIEASPGKTQAVTLGGPFTLQFAVEKSGDGIAINSEKMTFRGKAGEQYGGFTWKSEPQVSLLAGGKILPVGKMKFG